MNILKKLSRDKLTGQSFPKKKTNSLFNICPFRLSLGLIGGGVQVDPGLLPAAVGAGLLGERRDLGLAARAQRVGLDDEHVGEAGRASGRAHGRVRG